MEDIVPDDGFERACVGSWCGHDRYRMAHQDNPFLEAGNRCLVRGVCQWGSLERSVRGDSRAPRSWLITNPISSSTARVTKRRSVASSFEVVDGEGTGLAGVRAELRREDDQLIEFTAAGGMARFSDSAPGVWRVSAWAEGFAPENVEPAGDPSEVTRHRLSCGAAFGLGRRLTSSTVARRRSTRAPWTRRFLAWSATPVIPGCRGGQRAGGGHARCRLRRGVTSPQSSLPMTLLFALCGGDASERPGGGMIRSFEGHVPQLERRLRRSSGERDREGSARKRILRFWLLCGPARGHRRHHRRRADQHPRQQSLVCTSWLESLTASSGVAAPLVTTSTFTAA